MKKRNTKLPACLTPSVSLLSKLGSVIVHVEELYSSGGHEFDVVAFKMAIADPEVAEWIDQMSKLAFIPVKR